ncbi:MAG: ComEC/Rec2 family competence protein [Vicinamibacterales bacterium]
MRYGIVLAIAVVTATLVVAQPRNTLDVYFIDVEGGQSTLVVSPSGESMLIDAGFPGERDAGRIRAAAQAAGLRQIDYFLNTHFHGDHFGAIPELIKSIPVRTFVDHGTTVETSERALASFNTYRAARETGKHLPVKAGDKVPIAGIDVEVVIASGVPSAKNQRGGGAANPLCRDYQAQPDDLSDDAQSVGTVTRLGRFSMIDLGDLTWNKEYLLACPTNRIGAVDLYVTTRHGLNGAGLPALVHALRPRVAVMNNGPTKGASKEAWQTVKSAPGLEDLWQLHYSVKRPASTAPNLFEKSENGGPELNTAEQMIANLDETAGHTPAHFLKLSARDDGSFTITNPRTGFTKKYEARR